MPLFEINSQTKMPLFEPKVTCQPGRPIDNSPLRYGSDAQTYQFLTKAEAKYESKRYTPTLNFKEDENRRNCP